MKLLFFPQTGESSQDGLQLKLELKSIPVCGIPSSAVILFLREAGVEEGKIFTELFDFRICSD